MMEKNDNKLYGIFDTEAELQTEMDSLRLQGYRDEDMFIVSHRDDEFILHRGNGNTEEIRGGNWWDKFKAFMSGEETLDDNFRRLGLNQIEKDRFYYDLRNGRYLLYIDGDYDTFNSVKPFDNQLTNKEETLELHEERLKIDKDRVKTGEVNINKNVYEDEQIIEVPVEREEVYIERRPVNREVALDSETNFRADNPLNEEVEIHIPVTEEQVSVTKKDVVKEEIVVGKRKVIDTETVADTVRREEVDIDDTTNTLDDAAVNRNQNRF
jgi:uncharacterized protein (TIGR02271 family)